jgi:anti-sigma-K factor RskA
MSSHEHDPNCIQSVDAAPYVLGALDDGELRRYREHLKGCALCRVEVAELQGVVDELPGSAPPVAASQALRGRILATVRSEAELLHAAGHEADQPPKPVSRWRTRPLSFVSGGIALAGTAAVAVVIALSVGSGTPERVTPAQVASTLPGAQASLHRTGDRADLVVSGMPPPALGRIYEVWLKHGRSASAQPTDALFGVTSRGSAAVHVPNSLHGVTEVMVTNEPAGGSAHPTTKPLLSVALPS